MKTLIKTSIFILGVVAFVTQGVVIYIANTTSADSLHATSLSEKLDKLNEENVNLESKILTFASYQAIASRAAELGYTNTRGFISVYDPARVALGR